MNEPRRGRGRPSEGVKIEVRVPPEVLDEIDLQAEEAGVKRAALLREHLVKRFRPRS